MPLLPPDTGGGGEGGTGGGGFGGGSAGGGTATPSGGPINIHGGNRGVSQGKAPPLPVIGEGTAFSTRKMNANNSVNQAAGYADAREEIVGVEPGEQPFLFGMGLEMLDDRKALSTDPVNAPGVGAPSAQDDRRGTSPMPGRARRANGDPFAGMGGM